MTCKEVNKYWQDYIDGNCDELVEEKVTAHLDQCPHCSEVLAKLLKESEEILEVKDQENNQEFLITEKQQQKILRKARWKQRFSTAGFLLSLLILLLIVGSLLSGIYFQIGEKSKLDRARETMVTMTEMTVPNMTLSGRNENISPYFTSEIKSRISKRLGGNYNYSMGEISGNLLFSSLNVERDWKGTGELEVKLNFANPHYKHDERELGGNKAVNWKQLEKISQGTVSEVAVTLDEPVEIDDALEMFSGDFSVAWLAIDTGESPLIEKDYNAFTSQGDGLWGLPSSPYSEVLSGIWDGVPDYHEKTETGLFFKSIVEESMSWTVEEPGEEVFLKGLSFLKANEKWANSYPNYTNYTKDFTEELERIENYIDDKGAKVYGLVLTGPSEEILKLKDDERIKYLSIGEVDWWNWQDENFGRTLYQ